MADDDAGSVRRTTLAVPSRRSVLKVAGSAVLGAGAYALAACSSSTAPGTNGQAQTGSSVLDTWLSTKKAKLGVDLTTPPLQFKDSTGKPSGYMMDITNKMMSDLGVTPEFVEIPFGQLFAALAAGKFDMMGIAATILPSRSLKGMFSAFPVFYETIVIFLKPGSTLTSVDQLNSPNVTISVRQGTSQEYSAHQLFPKAKFVAFAQGADQLNELATGRADAAPDSEFNAAANLKQYPGIKIMAGPPLFVDCNTYFMPLGDFKLQAFVNNWLRYNATHQNIAALWTQWVGPQVAGLLTSHAVGADGEAVPVKY
jgi:polar amino acid transport system substrate-binding protein